MITIKDELDDAIPKDDAAAYGERLMLYAMVRALHPKTVVEIGTHRGLTSLYLACALHDNRVAGWGGGTLHTTDPFDYEQETNLTKFYQLRDFIKVHKVKGRDLEVDQVDFLFVDGFHEEEHVMAEIEHFLPRLTEKAVVIFHDCGGDNAQVGVNAAIKKAGLQTAFLPTTHCMRVYGHFGIDPKH